MNTEMKLQDENDRALHVPVMLSEILELLGPALNRPDSVLVDCTLGMAGHSSALLKANPQAKLVGIDRDPQALEVASRNLAEFSDRTTFVQARFDELVNLDLPRVDAVLFDLGLSSLQIDRTGRGFSYSHDSALDMRMGGNELTAAQIVNTYSQQELVKIFRAYGEEPNAKRIATAIVKEREKEPFEMSGRLVEVIADSLPAAVRHRGGHPAKRVFQALRIEVNGELDAFSAALPAALEKVNLGGRIAVLSYHSLEDRIAKKTFAKACSDDVPKDLPIVPLDRAAKFKLLTKGAQKPTRYEVEENSRSASARLRAVERIRQDEKGEI